MTERSSGMRGVKEKDRATISKQTRRTIDFQLSHAWDRANHDHPWSLNLCSLSVSSDKLRYQSKSTGC